MNAPSGRFLPVVTGLKRPGVTLRFDGPNGGLRLGAVVRVEQEQPSRVGLWRGGGE
jgi:hypothetical protein